MPRLYTDANPRMIAYYLDGGSSGYQELPAGHTAMEAEYLAIVYGLNEYFLKWSRELDARDSDMTRESKAEADLNHRKDEFFQVSTPSDRTKRPVPPPVLVLSDNQVVVNQLQRNYHIGNDRLRKLAHQVWQMTQNIEVKFEWTPRRENLAGKILR